MGKDEFNIVCDTITNKEAILDYFSILLEQENE